MSQPASDSSHSQVVSYATPPPHLLPLPVSASASASASTSISAAPSAHTPSQPSVKSSPASARTPIPPPSNPPSHLTSTSTPSVPGSTASVEEHLERLTTAVQENGHLLHVCTVLCEARCALARARDGEQDKRALSVQEQLARMLAMTQETLRREREVRVTSDPQKYVLDLQRAAFGAGSTPDSISRSSMMESD